MRRGRKVSGNERKKRWQSNRLILGRSILETQTLFVDVILALPSSFKAEVKEDIKRMEGETSENQQGFYILFIIIFLSPNFHRDAALRENRARQVIGGKQLLVQLSAEGIFIAFRGYSIRGSIGKLLIRIEDRQAKESTLGILRRDL